MSNQIYQTGSSVKYYAQPGTTILAPAADRVLSMASNGAVAYSVTADEGSHVSISGVTITVNDTGVYSLVGTTALLSSAPATGNAFDVYVLVGSTADSAYNNLRLVQAQYAMNSTTNDGTTTWYIPSVATVYLHAGDTLQVTVVNNSTVNTLTIKAPSGGVANSQLLITKIA